MISGLLGVGIALKEMELFLNNLPKDTSIIKQSIGITILAASLLILGKAVENMAKIDFLKMMGGRMALKVEYHRGIWYLI